MFYSKWGQGWRSISTQLVHKPLIIKINSAEKDKGYFCAAVGQMLISQVLPDSKQQEQKLITLNMFKPHETCVLTPTDRPPYLFQPQTCPSLL